MPTAATPHLRGSLDVIILKTLSWGPMHGFGIARWLRDVTDDTLALEEGTLYPALYRMEARGWVTHEWCETELRRRARYYRITAAGRRQLAADVVAWDGFVAMMTRILGATPAAA